MRRQELECTGHGGEPVPAVLYLPDSALDAAPDDRGDGGLPAVLLVHEVFGVDAHMSHLAEQLTAEGFACLLPDLWSRTGLPGPAPTPEEPAPEWSGDTLRAAVNGLADRQALGDLEGALRALGAHPEVDRERLAAVGFCMGGNLAFQLACTSREPLAAVVDYYGRVVYSEQSSAKPIQPLELALNLGCPLLCHFGELDASIPPEHVQQLEERLTMFSREFEIVRHANAGHGFQNDTRSGYHAAAAGTAWAQTLAFLRVHTAAN